VLLLSLSDKIRITFNHSYGVWGTLELPFLLMGGESSDLDDNENINWSCCFVALHNSVNTLFEQRQADWRV
jgi:hypothetical protein